MNGLRTIRPGDQTPQTDMIQLALTRAGFPVVLDGIYGSRTTDAVRRFQATRGLVQDGIVGPVTWAALKPYLTGSFRHTVALGDTFFKLAAASGSSVAAIQTANPDVNPNNLQIGQVLTIPLWFDIVPTNVRWSWALLTAVTEGISMRYPFIAFNSIGKSVMGRDILVGTMGNGENEVFYNAAHHANEWITTPVLLKFMEEYATAYSSNGSIFGYEAQVLYDRTTLYLAPMVDPDGVDLVTGDLTSGVYYNKAREIAAGFPAIPFPSGWKANIDGIDLNLQYPANWDLAREIKFAQGWTRPAPRDFVGNAPLEAPESRSVYDFTNTRNFSLTLSYHTQGQVIYWQYGDEDPPRAYEIGRAFERVSGYSLQPTPPDSANAGYKDWFIDRFFRPGYTIEAGSGISPLPLSQFENIYRNNLGILTIALIISI